MRHAESTPNLPHYAAPFSDPPGYSLPQQSSFLSTPRHVQERAFVHRDNRQPTFAPKTQFDRHVPDQVTFRLQEPKPNLGHGHTQSQPRDKGTELYKTELCRKWVTTGTCRYGSKCQFAHGVGELRKLVRHPLYKTSMCKSYQATGVCRYGSRCRFIHDETEQELSGLTRSSSTNNVAFLSNSAQHVLHQTTSTTRNVNGHAAMVSAFPRVPSAPENLNNHVPQRATFQNRMGFNGASVNGWTQSTLEQPHPATIPKNYSHGHFNVEGLHGQTGGYPQRRTHVAPPSRAMSSSFSSHDLGYQPRSRTHHSFSEDQGIFAAQDIAISSSTNSSYSSAASSGEQLGYFAAAPLDHLDKEDGQLTTDVAHRLLKSQSQPALANMHPPSIPKRIGGENGLELEDVAQQFESFHIADLSESAGTTTRGKNEGVESGAKASESRLDFFRSISNVDLASLDKDAVLNSPGRLQ